MQDELLTVAEVAGRLKMNQQTVRNWIDRGELQATRIGSRRVRIRSSVLDSFLDAQGDGTTAPADPHPAPEPQQSEPERRGVTERDIKVIERVIETMIVTSADLDVGSPLQRELAESAGRLQVALRTRESVRPIS